MNNALCGVKRSLMNGCSGWLVNRLPDKALECIDAFRKIDNEA